MWQRPTPCKESQGSAPDKRLNDTPWPHMTENLYTVHYMEVKVLVAQLCPTLRAPGL